MGVDLHRIRLGISSGNSRNGFGNIVSFPSGVANLPYGTEISRAVNTPYSAGSVMVVVNGVNYYGQKADFVTYADGAGGTYTAWENIVFATADYVNSFATINYTPYYPTLTPVNVTQLTSNFDSQYYVYLYHYHNGSGGYSTSSSSPLYFANGTLIGQASTPETIYYNGTSGPVPTGRNELVDCKWDGGGGYFTAFAGTSGSYYPYGTVIEFGPTTNYDTTTVGGLGSVNNGLYNIPSTWIYDGMGGSQSTTVNGGSYYSYGTYIGNDGSSDYYWNGSGGYYT